MKKTKFQKPPKQAGLTLIELMIVIVIIGVLASVAVPAFLRFSRKSKTSEAAINIKTITDSAITWYDDDHVQANTGDPMRKHFPHDGNGSQVRIGPKTSRRPLKDPCDGGKNPQYKKGSKKWDFFPWKRLYFGIAKAHYYQYRYTYHNSKTQAASFTIEARGDLDCDMIFSSFSQSALANLTTGEVERAEMKIQRALE